jgi:rubrerythrin
MDGRLLIGRREALVRAAAAAAGIGLAASLTTATRRARAKVEPEPDAEADTETLNALLAAEYDAVATYTAGAGIVAGDTGTPQAVRDLVTDVAIHFQSQHADHAAALKSMIEDNAGTPVEDSMQATLPASFPATTATTTDVIRLAADKEKQAAYTYAEVMKTISTQAAARLVASIGAVEAQHFVVLYLLAEGIIESNDVTAMNPELVSPAAFVLDPGDGFSNLENFPALDDLLTLDPPA